METDTEAKETLRAKARNFIDDNFGSSMESNLVKLLVEVIQHSFDGQSFRSRVRTALGFNELADDDTCIKRLEVLDGAEKDRQDRHRYVIEILRCNRDFVPMNIGISTFASVESAESFLRQNKTSGKFRLIEVIEEFTVTSVTAVDVKRDSDMPF